MAVDEHPAGVVRIVIGAVRMRTRLLSKLRAAVQSRSSRGSGWSARSQWAALVALALMFVSLHCVSTGVAIPGYGGVGVILGSVYVQFGVMDRTPSRSAFLYLHAPSLHYEWLPRTVPLPGASVFLVPLWLSFTLCLSLYLLFRTTSVLWQRRRAPPRCKTCGYSLIGLPQNRCPECGEVFDPAESEMYEHRRE